MAKVRKRPDRKGWFLDFVDEYGKRRKPFGGNTKREAERALAREMLRVESARRSNVPPPPDRQTLGGLVDEFIAALSVSPNTKRSKRQHLQAALEAFGVGTRPSAVRDLHVFQLVAERRAAGRKQNTIWIETCALRHLFSWATKHRPDLKIDIEFPTNKELGVRRQPAVIEVFSPGEVEDLLAASLASRCKWDHDLISMALFTGGRAFELCKLEKRDILLQTKWVRYRYGKHGKSRVAPLDDQQLPHLRERMLGLGDRDRLFVARGGRVLETTAIAPVFCRRQQEAGLARRNFHATRHTAITSWLLAGVDIFTVSKWAGHASTDETHGYLHFLPTTQDDAQKRLRKWRREQTRSGTKRRAEEA